MAPDTLLKLTKGQDTIFEMHKTGKILKADYDALREIAVKVYNINDPTSELVDYEAVAAIVWFCLNQGIKP